MRPEICTLSIVASIPLRLYGPSTRITPPLVVNNSPPVIDTPL